MYQALRQPRHETRRVRGLGMHLTRWGPAPAASSPPLLLLPGWQDTAATFQFMADAFAEDWPLLGLDWRGFGRSEWPQEGYWFPDYLADLDALLDQLAPDAPACLIGHSMGGNIATLYAGLRPGRVRSVVSLEGFGLPRAAPSQAPAQLRRWLDQVKAAPVPKDYDSFEQLAAVIRFRYPRFSAAQASFVAGAWGTPHLGRVRLLGDGRHRWVNPVLYNRADAEAIWRQVEAPILMLLGDESEYLPKLGADGSDAALRALFTDVNIVHIAAAGHMLHIERAELVASSIENFLSAPSCR